MLDPLGFTLFRYLFPVGFSQFDPLPAISLAFALFPRKREHTHSLIASGCGIGALSPWFSSCLQHFPACLPKFPTCSSPFGRRYDELRELSEVDTLEILQSRSLAKCRAHMPWRWIQREWDDSGAKNIAERGKIAPYLHLGPQ